FSPTGSTAARMARLVGPEEARARPRCLARERCGRDLLRRRRPRRLEPHCCVFAGSSQTGRADLSRLLCRLPRQRASRHGRAAAPSPVELTNPDSSDWLYHTGTISGMRYSRLSQLAPANVGRLAVACVFQVGSSETFQTGPLVYRGVMYLTTVRQTIAIDAATRRPRWRHTWQPRDYELWPMNRGVALARGYVVRGTADGYLLGPDA